MGSVKLKVGRWERLKGNVLSDLSSACIYVHMEGYAQVSVYIYVFSGAVCCSVVQCFAVCCSVLQCVAVCCSVWLCGMARITHVVCNVFRRTHTHTHMRIYAHMRIYIRHRCRQTILQHVHTVTNARSLAAIESRIWKFPSTREREAQQQREREWITHVHTHTHTHKHIHTHTHTHTCTCTQKCTQKCTHRCTEYTV